MSSLTNFAMVIYVARTVGAAQFGAFSLAYVTYSFALNASRGLATDPLVVRFTGTDLPAWRRAVGSCSGTATAMGLAIGAGIVLVTPVLHGTVRGAFLALGLTLPGLLLQDSWRYAFFVLGRGGQAFLNDVAWALALLPALLFLRLTGQGSVFWFVFAWGAAATAAAVAGMLQARVIPSVPGSKGWVSQHRDLGPRYLAEGTSQTAAIQLRSYGVGSILGLAAVGYVQAVNTLVGPFMVIYFGMNMFLVPEAARVLRRSPQRLLRFCLVASGGLALLALAWGIVLLVALPAGLGAWLLGQLWRPTYPLVLPQTLWIAGAAFTIGARAGLHALAAARRSLRAMVITSIAFLALSLVGAAVGGTVGTMRGAAASAWIGCLLWWWEMGVALRKSGREPRPARLEPNSPADRRPNHIWPRRKAAHKRRARAGAASKAEAGEMTVSEGMMRAADGHFKVTTPVPRAVWESVFRSDPNSVVTQSRAWHDAVLEIGRHKDASVLFEFESGHQVLLPMAQPRWRTPLDPVAASWPHRWGVGGPLCREGRITPAEAAAVLEHVRRHGIMGGELHLSHAAAPVWLDQARRYRVVREPCYVIDLTGGFEEVWKHRFQRSIRQAVHKAENSGVEIEADRSGKLLDSFYDLYERSMPRWAGIAHEPAWFAKWHMTRATPMSMLVAVAEHLGDACTTWVARSGDDPVAIIIVLRIGWHCVAWKAAMDKERAAPLRAFQLLHRLAIEDACQAGCRIYDMQVANPGSSLAISKERLGATLCFTHYVQAERLPVHRAMDASKGLARKLIDSSARVRRQLWDKYSSPSRAPRRSHSGATAEPAALAWDALRCRRLVTRCWTG